LGHHGNSKNILSCKSPLKSIVRSPTRGCIGTKNRGGRSIQTSGAARTNDKKSTSGKRGGGGRYSWGCPITCYRYPGKRSSTGRMTRESGGTTNSEIQKHRFIPHREEEKKRKG